MLYRQNLPSLITFKSMNLLKNIQTTFATTVIFIALFLLTGCQEPAPHPQLAVLHQAQKEGKLDQQAAALKILIQQAKAEQIAQYQMALEDIHVVKQLNQRAKQQLDENKFNALNIAVSADKKRFNNESRQIITTILKPFVPYYDLKPRLQQWSYPSINKVVVSGLMSNPITPWTAPLNIPTIWPDTQLIKTLQTPDSDMLKQLFKLANEHQQWLEIDRLTQRMLNQAPNETDLVLLYDDVTAINQMYNTLVSDLRYYYLKQAINHVSAQLQEQIISTEQTEVFDQQAFVKDRISDWRSLRYCCQNYLLRLHKAFAYLPTSDRYTDAITTIDNQWHQWLDKWQKKGLTQVLAQGLAQAKDQQQTKPQWLSQLTAQQQALKALKTALTQLQSLHQQTPRRDIAQHYIQVTYRWHQGNFSEIEAIMPHISAYRTAIFHY